MKKISQIPTILRFFIFKLKLYFFNKSIINKANRKAEKIIAFKSKYGFNINLNLAHDVDKYFYLGIFEPETIWVFRKLIKPGSIIFDIGANIGIYSLIAAKQLNNSGKIYAFEPADRAYNQFQKNIELNQFNNILLFKLGMADKAGVFNFNICEDDAYNSIGENPMRESLYKIQIPVSSIDEFCQKNNIKKIDVLKIDTEGAENLVIKGGENILKGMDSPIIFCEYNRLVQANDSLIKLESLLSNFGYKIYYIKYGMLMRFDSNSRSSDIVAMKDRHKDLIS